MPRLTRNFTIGFFSLILITVVMFFDVRMETASADEVANQPEEKLALPLIVSTSSMFMVTTTEAEAEAVEIAPAQDEVGHAEPSAPNAASSQLQKPYAAASANPGKPTRLIIPSIGLDVHVEHLGVNAKGEMDVPGGETDNVGWYKRGTVPGKTGSAVIAAHVFAAFAKLDQLSAGSDIYIVTEKNERLHFVVQDSKEYALAEVSPAHLFNRKDARRLNLITCAGQFIPSIDTYNRRLIVYATLVG